ncbi:hypothetical protein [Oceanicella actignis]|uniref:VPLPA-CTERM protein sorting domain-containing protein n=1 Tax=Oceanicella actignis TaxID=1189325 RepID=A0A1M7STP2_9RHOB|nr:hypothetical protein [Oceanicella actignis]SES69959.1 VPLPA-CTERM protein sorting domain-containing protein [Oceanicella actignis]SHN61766.1 VPLPA-CTERM protein sorting domain-containing protein [Oceanicella actignis]
MMKGIFSWLAAAALTATGALAAPITGNGDPLSDPAAAGAVKFDFESVAPGAYTVLDLGLVKLSGWDLRSGGKTAAPLHVDSKFPIDHASALPTPFGPYSHCGDYVCYDTSGKYNTQGQSLSNGEESINYDDGGAPLPYVTQIEFLFTAPATFFAMNLGGLDNTWELATYDASDALIDFLEIAPQFSSSTGQYYGASSAAGIVRATLTSRLGFAQNDPNGEMILLDNLTVSVPPTPAPLPAGLPLMAAALAALGFAARRRKS